MLNRKNRGKYRKLYKGLVQTTIEAGLNSVYPPEGGWEHEGTVCENDFAWQEYDCSVFPGMFLEVHNCTVSVFFGNG